MQYTTNGGVAENVFHVKDPDGWTGIKLEQLGVDFINYWHDHYRAAVSTQVALQRVVVTDLTTQTGLQVTVTTGLPQPGTQGANAFPDNVTVAIKLMTPFRGRSARGRFFWVGLPANFAVTDYLTSTGLAAVQVAAASVLVAPTGAGQEIGVVSLCHNHNWRLTGDFIAYTDLFVDPALDSQRRRLAGRGQ